MPGALTVHLSAEIEMISGSTFLVSNIRRMASDESPLLPELKLIKDNGKWEHSETGKESNISKALGVAIDRHLSEVLKEPDPKKDSR
jgi:hypothetical protein